MAVFVLGENMVVHGKDVLSCVEVCGGRYFERAFCVECGFC